MIICPKNVIMLLSVDNLWLFLSLKKKEILAKISYLLQTVSSMENNWRQQNVEKDLWVKRYLKV